MSTAPTISPSNEATLSVEGMNCASCVAHVEKTAAKVVGVQECAVNLAMGKAVVKFDPAQTSPQQISKAITDAGYPAEPKSSQADAPDADEHRLNRQRKEARGWFRRAMLGLALWFPVEITHWITYFVTGHHESSHVDWMTWISLAAGTIAILFIGSAFFKSAFKSLRAGTTNMDVLISMGAGVAYVYSLAALIGHLKLGWPLPHLYFMESAGLLALISLGHWLEARARESAGSAIRGLMNLAPQTARLLAPTPRILGEGRGEGSSGRRISLTIQQNTLPPTPLPEYWEGEKSVPVSQLKVGDQILVKPGDRIPIDGAVYAGKSSVNESMITGEPIPVTRSPGDTVIGGTINLDGALRIRVTKTGSETALTQIIKLVEDAQTSKPQVQKLADRISAVFVPAVLLIALVTGIGWYIYGSAVGLPSPQLWGKLANAVCSVLIIACPCALGLAMPAAIMVGTGRGAQRGILIRDIDAIQNAEEIDTVVLDKTGTITEGKPFVTKVQTWNGVSENELLAAAASSEVQSEHPLGKAIVAAARERNRQIDQPHGFQNATGGGVTADIGSSRYFVGSESHLRDAGVSGMIDDNDDDDAVGSIVHVARIELGTNGEPTSIGRIVVSDRIKSDSKEAIDALYRMKLKPVMLTGDHSRSAIRIGLQLGLYPADDADNQIISGVKPDQKAAVIRELQNRQSPIGNRQSKVAMVGDGINDAAALAAADLGIAIGSGSDIAKEVGDIVLVGGSLTGVPAAINLSRATMRKIRQNLFFAFLYNVLAIPLAAFGLLNPMIAAGAMALSDVTVIGNALLLRRAKID